MGLIVSATSKINTFRDFYLPGSPNDSRLLHADASDRIFVHPSHLCQGYEQNIFLEDDITLILIDQTITQAVMVDAPDYGNSIEFEFQLAGLGGAASRFCHGSRFARGSGF